MPQKLSWKHFIRYSKKGFENIFYFKGIFTLQYVTDTVFVTYEPVFLVTEHRGEGGGWAKVHTHPYCIGGEYA